MKLRKNDLYVLLGLIVVLLGILWILRRRRRTESFVSKDTVPRIIWAYWDTPSMPRTVQMCQQSWKKYAPGYDIRLLHKDTLHKYVRLPQHILEHPNFNDSSARFTDLLRLHLLNEYGGIWMDASILMSEPLDAWLSLDDNQEFFGYYSAGHTRYDIPPVIESWFLVSKKNSPFMKAWCSEFLRMAEFPTVKDYVQSVRDMGVNTKSLDEINYAEYLAVFVASMKVLQADKYPVDKLKLFKAEDGPYRYNTMFGGDLKKSLPNACTDPSVRKPMIKLTHFERDELESHLDDSLSNDKCHWI